MPHLYRVNYSLTEPDLHITGEVVVYADSPEEAGLTIQIELMQHAFTDDPEIKTTARIAIPKTAESE